MLVVEAARAGQFHVYPVTTVDEGIALLTGVPAGEPDAEGNYPPDTINGRVVARLTQLAEKQRAFHNSPKPLQPDGQGEVEASGNGGDTSE